MGTLGSSSQLGTGPEAGIRTKPFQQKYIQRLAELKMLTPGQRDGIYQEIALEEANWLQGQDQAAMEYEEILKVQEMVESKNATHS